MRYLTLFLLLVVGLVGCTPGNTGARAWVSVPSSTVEMATYEVELDEKGGTAFRWSVAVTNHEDRPVFLTVKASFKMSPSGEEAERLVEFYLKEGEHRKIDGCRIRPTKPFMLVEGNASIVKKYY